MEKEIIFPENISLTIKKILEKYKREETIEEVFEKAMKNIKTNREKMAEIIFKLAHKEIEIEKLPQVLKENFDLTEVRASLMAKDIEEEILKKIGIEIKKEEEVEKKEISFKRTSDIYREPID